MSSGHDNRGYAFADVFGDRALVVGVDRDVTDPAFANGDVVCQVPSDMTPQALPGVPVSKELEYDVVYAECENLRLMDIIEIRNDNGRSF